MALRLRIGRGLRAGEERAVSVIDAEIERDHATWTLEQLGHMIGKQLGVIDGEVELKSLLIEVRLKHRHEKE